MSDTDSAVTTLTDQECDRLAALGQPCFNHRIGRWSHIPQEAFYQWHLERDGLHLTWAAPGTSTVGGIPRIRYRGIRVDIDAPGPWVDVVRDLIPRLEAEAAAKKVAEKEARQKQLDELAT